MVNTPDGPRFILAGGTLALRVWLYDVEGNEWKEVASMPHDRYEAGYTVFEGQLIIAGGWGDDLLKSIVQYNGMTDKWTVWDQEMLEAHQNPAFVAWREK